MCAYLSSEPSRSRPAFLAVFLGALFSLVIELLQFYVPIRSSNVSDIITNSFGTFLGVLLFRSRIAQSLLASIVLPSA
jgi:glycopeptide antibiotics resistance protein